MKRTFLAVKWAGLLLVGLLGCGDDTSGTGGNNSAGGTADGAGAPGGASSCASHSTSDAPDFDPTAGLFTLQSVADSDFEYASFAGSLKGAPNAGFHTEAARQGQCRLLTFTASNCTPDCELGSFCIDDACVTPSAAIDAGALTLSGILPTPVTPDDGGIGVYYWSSEDAGPYGNKATLSATGGEAGDFELSVCLPAPMTPTIDWAILMQARADGEDVTLTWTNPLPGARIYTRMTTGIGTHGGISPVEVECEGPDTGSLTLPGAYLDQLFENGWSCGECGDNKLWRYYSDDAAITPGTVRFRGETSTYFFFHP